MNEVTSKPVPVVGEPRRRRSKEEHRNDTHTPYYLQFGCRPQTNETDNHSYNIVYLLFGRVARTVSRLPARDARVLSVVRVHFPSGGLRPLFLVLLSSYRVATFSFSVHTEDW